MSAPIARRRSPGFTLLEVLIALAVFSIFSTGLLVASSENAKSAAYLENVTLAMWLAENKLNAARIIGSKAADRGSSTEFFAGREWTVDSTVTPGEIPNSGRMTVEIRLKDAPSTERALFELTGYL